MLEAYELKGRKGKKKSAGQGRNDNSHGANKRIYTRIKVLYLFSTTFTFGVPYRMLMITPESCEDRSKSNSKTPSLNFVPYFDQNISRVNLATTIACSFRDKAES